MLESVTIGANGSTSNVLFITGLDPKSPPLRGAILASYVMLPLVNGADVSTNQ